MFCILNVEIFKVLFKQFYSRNIRTIRTTHTIYNMQYKHDRTYSLNTRWKKTILVLVAFIYKMVHYTMRGNSTVFWFLGVECAVG